MVISTSDFRKGLKLEFKGDPYEIVDFQHVKMGRGGANVKTKMKNLKTGGVVEETIRSGEKFPTPELEEKRCSFFICRTASIISWTRKHLNSCLLPLSNWAMQSCFLKRILR